MLSLIAHVIIFLWLFFLPSGIEIAPPSESAFIATLKEEPVKQIQMKRSTKKAPPKTGDSTSQIESATGKEEQGGGLFEQAGQAFRLPESGILFYDAYVDGQQVQTGQINWQADSSGYSLSITILYAFVGPFVFESKGKIDAYGLAPSIYWAQRGNNPPRFSRFERNAQGGPVMFFSEKMDFSPPIPPGTQDRFSLIFQFASLLNGDDKIDEAGTVRSIPVASFDSIEPWQFKSYGEVVSEDVPSMGMTTLRHYELLDRPSNKFKRRVDLWLVRDLEWLPGRIRTLEANGRVFELVFKQKNPLNPTSE
ncbi:MAG: DUF3108 domain-containing protein [Polynucleobacter sp.]|nr:DUF3108 domain-containing protein [Polynucleobacter sp.]